ncbi:MAG: GPR endopeptidase [Oscillospiraceae bacterium]|jgi:spore protease
MKRQPRTDLAVEARELWEQAAEKTTELPGVKARDSVAHGYPLTTVEIIDDEGSKALNKPRGTYHTLTLEGFRQHTDDAFERAVNAISDQLRPMLQVDEGALILVAGLGNSAITPDALGPRAAQNVMVTRHLVERSPQDFGAFRPVAAVAPGVLGTTGVESFEIVRSVAEKIKPATVIAVDALASMSPARVCTTVQISDTGISPGSGVGNNREALDQATLGVPVIAVGIPTVVDAATLAIELDKSAGLRNVDEDELRKAAGDMIVTPRTIDNDIVDLSRLVGYALNIALQKNLTINDVTMFLS